MGLLLDLSILFALQKVSADIIDALGSSLFSFGHECLSLTSSLFRCESLGGVKSGSTDIVVLLRSNNAIFDDFFLVPLVLR